MPLDYRKFYEFRDPIASRPLRLSPDEQGYVEWLTRDRARQLSKGKLELTKPLRLDAYMGGQATEVLWSGMVALVCISPRVQTLLQEHLVTGWATYPVEVFGRKGEHLPGYHGLAVTGAECDRDRSRSEIVDKPAPVPNGQGYRVYRSLYFAEDQWDGSDMFWIHRSGIVVTEKLFQLFKKEKITNVRFTPLPEVEIDVKLDDYE